MTKHINPHDVIESYVHEVTRRTPRQNRNELAFELRQLLIDMLDDRARESGQEADESLALKVLREFGTPAEVAARYLPPTRPIVPLDQNQSFMRWAMVGLLLQWALTLPGAVQEQALGQWWFTWGLGAFWWPGFMVTHYILRYWWIERGWYTPTWHPRRLDADRIHPPTLGLALVAMLLGTLFMMSMPWWVQQLRGPLKAAFAFDPDFLTQRAWLAVPLWLLTLGLHLAVFRQGRWTRRTRQLETGANIGFVGVMAYWISAGNIFQAQLTDGVTKGALLLVILIILISLLIAFLQRRPALRPPPVSHS